MKSMSKACLAFVAFGLTVAAGPAAYQDDGDDWAFTLVNHHTSPITIFQGSATGTRWSDNWLDAPVHMGRNKALRFNRNATTNCSVQIHVAFEDGQSVEDEVDFCGKRYVNVTTEAIWSE